MKVSVLTTATAALCGILQAAPTVQIDDHAFYTRGHLVTRLVLSDPTPVTLRGADVNATMSCDGATVELVGKLGADAPGEEALEDRYLELKPADPGTEFPRDSKCTLNVEMEACPAAVLDLEGVGRACVKSDLTACTDIVTLDDGQRWCRVPKKSYAAKPAQIDTTPKLSTQKDSRGRRFGLRFLFRSNYQISPRASADYRLYEVRLTESRII